MSAYMIVSVDVEDPVVFGEFKARFPDLMRKYGGEYLVRGGRFVILEGDWRPIRLVIFRFPDITSVETLYKDPEYQPLKALRQRASKMDIVVVEGL